MAAPLPDGVYFIKNLKSSTFMDLRGDGAVICYPPNYQTNQQWRLSSRGSYAYSIQSMAYNFPFLTTSGKTEDGTPLGAGTSQFNWDIIPDESNHSVFRIWVHNISPGKNADLESHGDGPRVQLWWKWDSPDPQNNGDHQKWVFIPVTPPTSTSYSYTPNHT